jgi:NAD+ synthase (glutamine-hydrolysing)
MRIAFAQLNPTVGDVAGNTALVLNAMDEARSEKADLLVCAEMNLLGYPPRDLLFREGVVEHAEAAVATIADHAGDLTVVVGHPRRHSETVRTIRNSVSVCRAGKVLCTYDKRLLPGYDVFDEDRYFDPGGRTCIIDVAGRRVGVLICEDLWRAGDVAVNRVYDDDPAAELVDAGCELLVSPNASPFFLGKFDRHVELLRENAKRLRVPIAVVNQVGGNDDLIFDGRSMLVDRDGALRVGLPAFESCVRTVDLDDASEANADVHGFESVGVRRAHGADSASASEWELFHALRVGVRDYCHKTGHRAALVGLSGGIDSALTATIAAAALGPGNVRGITMPSRYSSRGSIDDSKELAANLGLAGCDEVPIDAAHQGMREMLGSTLGEQREGLTDENIQSRLRGVILMAHSNATGALVLATGNKSEYAVGYATLYGDMCGALAVLGDVLKTRVYSLSRWINADPAACGFAKPPIPETTIAKAPSAELRPDQTDQDSLPPYDVLDEIITRYLDLEQSVTRIIAETGFDDTTVCRSARLIDAAEYKRYQAAIILKVTQRAFGRGRPMPIVMRG